MTDSYRDPSSDDNAALLALLDGVLTLRNLTAGEVLFDQGEPDDRLFVLDTGELEVSVLAASGRKLSLNRLQPGSVFGEIALFDPGPRTARVEALCACRLRYARQTDLREAMARQPDLATGLLRLAGQRMRWMSRQLEDQVFLPPASRLAAKTLFLAGETGTVAMSQAQLADYVGVTREVVSRILNEWRRAGWIEVSRGRIAILDRAGLLAARNASEI